MALIFEKQKWGGVRNTLLSKELWGLGMWEFGRCVLQSRRNCRTHPTSLVNLVFLLSWLREPGFRSLISWLLNLGCVIWRLRVSEGWVLVWIIPGKKGGIIQVWEPQWGQAKGGSPSSFVYLWFKTLSSHFRLSGECGKGAVSSSPHLPPVSRGLRV